MQINKLIIMLNAVEIERLITMPKKILDPPPKDFKQMHKHLQKDFTLQSIDGKDNFSVFMRRHTDFQENFAIGLIFYPPGDRSMTLFRCNGNHCEVVKDPLRPLPHFDYHTHILTQKDLENGIREPLFSEVTNEYASCEEALLYFVKKVNILDLYKHFDLQLKLF